MDEIISFKDVTFFYQDNQLVLDNISFSIKRNSYNLIIGHNGSGKSTIAKLLCGLELAKKGEIIIDGVRVIEDNTHLIRKNVGIVFQNPDNQFIANSVKEDIIFGLENHQVNPSMMDKIVIDISKKTNIENLLDKEPSLLSGGEKQRVALASVTSLNPKILILDEASSMLDPSHKKQFKNLVESLKKINNLTIISISHDINETLQADNIILLNKGKIVFEGTKERLYEIDLEKYNLDYPSLIKLQKKMNIYPYLLNEDELAIKLRGKINEN